MSYFKHKAIQCLEWCTVLPSKDCPRESPVFLLNGNEWVFRLQFHQYRGIGDYYCVLYLVLKTNRSGILSYRVHYEVGFKNENNLSLAKGDFNVQESERVWDTPVSGLKSKLPSDYIMGNWLKFQIYFHDVSEDVFKKDKQVGNKSVQTPSYADARLTSESVVKDLSKLFDDSQHCDVEFICGDEIIKAHKLILCSRSDVFASMLHIDMTEGKTGRVNIEDMDATIFKLFLKFLYTGMLPELTVDTAVRFYEASDKYNVASLRKLCADYLVDNLSSENMCDILILADRHNDSDFKKAVVQYIKEQK